ncbi:MAG: sugar ABC transporter substrate-binding protein [Ruminococcaceae bacterium]|nr:sugar ABC transporter substrate-binding protein [Oscillospiraceae bacterium]
MKKFLALTLAMIMALSLVACGEKKDDTTTSNTEDTIEIAVVLKTLSSEYWGYVKAGCEKAAAELGENVKVTVVGPGAESDIAGQVTMIEEQIAANVDAIICAPNDADAACAALAAALEKKIPVLAVDTNLGLDGQTAFVGTMNDVAAEQGGIWAIDTLGTDIKAVIIYGQEGDNTSNLRRAGYEKACADKGVEVLDALSGQNTTDGATKTMEDLLTSYAGEIDVVFCHNDDTAIGAMQACKSAEVTDITIVGFDGNKSALDLIKAGELVKATVAQQPEAMGYDAVMNAYKAIKGEAVEEVIAAPVAVVNAENVDEFLK